MPLADGVGELGQTQRKDGHVEPRAWFRAIYADEIPVGFAMLYALMNLGGFLPAFLSPARQAIGIGGLFCANLLAREGLSVLLVEEHYMVGGYCSTFRRKGYTFDACIHWLMGSSPGTNSLKVSSSCSISFWS